MKILNSIETLEKMGYTSATKHDKEAIEEFLYQGFELDIDENNKVWTRAGVCVAEVMRIDKKLEYSQVKELKETEDISLVNELIQKNWMLLIITSKNEKLVYLLGRV